MMDVFELVNLESRTKDELGSEQKYNRTYTTVKLLNATAWGSRQFHRRVLADSATGKRMRMIRMKNERGKCQLTPPQARASWGDDLELRAGNGGEGRDDGENRL